MEVLFSEVGSDREISVAENTVSQARSCHRGRGYDSPWQLLQYTGPISSIVNEKRVNTSYVRTASSRASEPGVSSSAYL